MSCRTTGSNHLEASALQEIWSRRRLRNPAAMTLCLQNSRLWGMKSLRDPWKIMSQNWKSRRKVGEIWGMRAEGPTQRLKTNFRHTSMKSCLIPGWCRLSFTCRKSRTISTGLQLKGLMASFVNYIRRKRRERQRRLFRRWRPPFVLVEILTTEISPRCNLFIRRGAQPKPLMARDQMQLWIGLIAKFCTTTNTSPCSESRDSESLSRERTHQSPHHCFSVPTVKFLHSTSRVRISMYLLKSLRKSRRINARIVKPVKLLILLPHTSQSRRLRCRKWTLSKTSCRPPSRSQTLKQIRNRLRWDQELGQKLPTEHTIFQKDLFALMRGPMSFSTKTSAKDRSWVILNSTWVESSNFLRRIRSRWWQESGIAQKKKRIITERSLKKNWKKHCSAWIPKIAKNPPFSNINKSGWKKELAIILGQRFPVSLNFSRTKSTLETPWESRSCHHLEEVQDHWLIKCLKVWDKNNCSAPWWKTRT